MQFSHKFWYAYSMKILITLLILLPLSSQAFSSKEDVVKSASKKIEQAKQAKFENKVLSKSFSSVIKSQKTFSKKALKNAFDYLDKNYTSLKPEGLCLNKDNKRNRKIIRNKSCLVVADYTKSKRLPRLLVINPQTGESELFYTAHGKGSHEPDKIETGHMAKRFSNVSGSNMTSLGFYLTDNIYNSHKTTFGPGPKNGLKMDGLNCTNNNARMRYIVMHTADYVQSVKGDPLKNGNSEGCVTLPEMRKDIISKCQGGALVYTYHE